VETLGQGWTAEEALSIAVYCALVADSPREALLLAVNHGGDSDSTGAICGNIVGAWLGEDALPADWAAGVEARDLILQVADDLANRVTVPSIDRYPA
jgi:ADP-ribosylglycohydrolase